MQKKFISSENLLPLSYTKSGQYSVHVHLVPTYLNLITLVQLFFFFFKNDPDALDDLSIFTNLPKIHNDCDAPVTIFYFMFSGQCSLALSLRIVHQSSLNRID